MALTDLFIELACSQDSLKDVINHYGKDTMSTIAIEEMSEVIKAITKIKRYGLTDKYKNDLEEEVADALICIYELILMGYIDTSNVKEWQYSKIKREERRIK